MKKTLTFLLLVAMMATMYVAPASAASMPEASYYNVQDVFTWPGFEYDLKNSTYSFSTSNMTVNNPGLNTFPDYFVKDEGGVRSGQQSFKFVLPADKSKDNAHLLSYSVRGRAISDGPLVDGTPYSATAYTNIDDAAIAGKRFLVNGWVKPVENVCGAVVLLFIVKFTGGSASYYTTQIKSVNLQNATDWTNVSAVVDFDRILNGNPDGYALPAGFPTRSEDYVKGSSSIDGWKMQVGIRLYKNVDTEENATKGMTAYLDDYGIIEQVKTDSGKFGNVWTDPGCEGSFANFSNAAGYDADKSGRVIDEKHSGDSSFKITPTVTSTYQLKALGRKVQINPLKPYYYSFWIKTSEDLTGAILGLNYEQYGFSNTEGFKSTSYITLVRKSLSGLTNWTHVEGIVMPNRYMDLKSNGGLVEKKPDGTGYRLTPDDVFNNTYMYFTLTGLPTNATSGNYSLYFDDIEFRELPMVDDGYENSTLTYNDVKNDLTYSSSGNYVLTEYYKNDELVYDYDNSIASGGTLKVKSIFVGNSTAPEYQAVSITGAYSSDSENVKKLDTYVVKPQQIIPKNGCSSIEYTITVPAGSEELKTFTFKDLSSISPLTAYSDLKIAE